MFFSFPGGYPEIIEGIDPGNLPDLDALNLKRPTY